MPNIEIGEAQTWLEPTKAYLGADLDDNMETSIASQVLSRVATSYDVSGWTTPETTPTLVRKIIGMKYASWFYNRLYSEDSDGGNDYALLLNGQAEVLLDGVVSGANDLVEVPGSVTVARGPSYEESSPVFTMGRVF
jgi:hypothetical protein